MKKNIELLENEINGLGPSWNLFGKVDKMKYLLKKIKEDFNKEPKEDILRPKKCLNAKNYDDCIVWLDEKRCIKSCDLHVKNL